MKNKRRVWTIAGILIVVLGISFFLIKNYNDNQLIGELPQIPNLEGSSATFQSFIKTANEKVLQEPSHENLGELGMVYQSNDFTDEAKTCYELAIKEAPEDWRWNYYLGCLKRELGDSESSIANFKAVLEVNSSVYMALYYLGEAYQQTNAQEAAENIFKRLSKLNTRHFFYKNTKRTSYFPLPVYASLQLSKLYLNSDKIDLAESQLKRLIKQQITFGPAYRQLSILYAQKDNKELSQYYSERSNDLNIYISPLDTLLDKMTLRSRTESYLLKQIDDARRSSNSHWALELVNIGLNNVPDSKYLVSKGIKQFLDMKASQRVFPYLDKHLRLFKDNHKELVEVGLGLSRAGLRNEAGVYFIEAEKVTGEKAKTKSTLAGMFYEKLGMEDKALELINEVLVENPKDGDILSDAIFLFIQMNKIEEAKKYMSLLKKLSPERGYMNVFEGIIAEKNGNVTQSIKFFEKAFKANPDKQFIINRLATYYKKNKLWTKMVDLYKKALEEKPNDSSLQEAYGSLLVNCPNTAIRNPKKAKEYSERAFINYSYNVQTRISAGRSLAEAYFQLQDWGKAVFYIHKTIDIAKRSHASKKYIEELEYVLGQYQKVLDANR